MPDSPIAWKFRGLGVIAVSYRGGLQTIKVDLELTLCLLLSIFFYSFSSSSVPVSALNLKKFSGLRVDTGVLPFGGVTVTSGVVKMAGTA